MKSSQKRVLHRMRHRMNDTLVEGLNCHILKTVIKHLTSDEAVLLFLDFVYFRYQRQ